MGMLDFLIDQSNRTPIPDAEYYYAHDKIWRAGGGLESESIEKGATAYNVVKGGSGEYIFKLREREGLFRCVYGWAFVLKTEENLAHYKEWARQHELWQELQRRAIQYHDTHVISLDGDSKCKI